MARLTGIGSKEVKQLIATLIFICIWHNDTEQHEMLWEKRFCCNVEQLLLSVITRGNSAPVWSLCAKRQLKEKVVPEWLEEG